MSLPQELLLRRDDHEPFHLENYRSTEGGQSIVCNHRSAIQMLKPIPFS